LWVVLSHKLGVKTPSFAAGPTLTISPIKEIRAGGSSNSYTLSLPNHLGTHVDAPRHSDDRGRAVADYPFDSFVFLHPIVLELTKGDSEMITLAELKRYESEISKADLLLIRTRFQECRGRDPNRYMNRNPGVSAQAAAYLASGFPKLRALGFDFISLSAVQNREEGGKAHRALLTGRDFFIIEDMDLSHFPKNVKRVLVVPLFIEGVDSTPCTVLAEE
jgi:arylformamidase